MVKDLLSKYFCFLFFFHYWTGQAIPIKTTWGQYSIFVASHHIAM